MMTDMFNLVGLNPTRTNILEVLIGASRERSHLHSPVETSEHRQLIATERLHNRVIVYVKSTGAGFTRNAVEAVGNKVIKVLKGALWYIDTAHQQFKERSISLTIPFEEFQGYNDYRKIIFVGKIIFPEKVAWSPFVCTFVLGGKDLFFLKMWQRSPFFMFFFSTFFGW